VDAAKAFAPRGLSSLEVRLAAYNAPNPYVLGFCSPTISVEELNPMAIDIEHLKHFQSEQLEQKNIQTSARIPIHTRTTEWALIEIVILLTGISDSLKRMADRP
jgi:hypothetical protein